ncbi:Kinase-like protein [Mycena sanguinolenta]|uniref:Kinase-like protein n=1 Tax=Mycena sanguinolenta TaxID=230812 RepID=A0A8H6XUR6_9AGAR|nr:Kinase-like protein [Mycena sanguinolenta]
MSLPIVPALGAAFTVLGFVVSTIQALEANKDQLRVLTTSCQQLLTTLNKEFSELRLVPDKCTKPLADLETLLRDIHRFAEKEQESGFLKILLQKDARVFKIEAFQKRIGLCISAFEISSLLNIQTMLAESKKARARDVETVHAHLNVLEKNNAKLLQTLEVNQNNTIAMMVSIQKQLNNQSVDRVEQRFYTHTLEYLTSRSGENVTVEDWMISSFEVDYGSEIGSGGFGTVYRGTWNRTEVAIKVLQNQAGVKPSVASLKNEIDIWSTLRHPNILQFLGANTLDDKPFIVMPYVPLNARQFLQVRPSFEPLYILRDISLGLEYLHSRKICHGDLKGINILVEDSGKALLCDFGLARLKADAATRTVVQVDTPQIVGSRNWMSPEVLTGSRFRITSDVYAFGMTLYELYADETPLVSVPYTDLVDLVVNRGVRPEPPEPGEGREIPVELWELAEECWMSAPQKRPTATQLHDTLTQMIIALPQPSVPRTNAERADHERPSISTSGLKLGETLVHGDYLDSLTPELDLDFDTEDFRRLAKQQMNIVAANQSMGKVDDWEALSAMQDLASTYYRLGMYGDAEALQIQVLDKCTKTLGQTHQGTLTAMYNLAATNRRLGRPKEALTLVSNVVQSWRRVQGDTDLQTLRRQYGLALTYYHLERYKDAEELQMNVVKHRKRILGRKHHETLKAMECLAATCFKLHDSRRAADITSDVIGRRKRTLGKKHPYTVAAMERLVMLILPHTPFSQDPLALLE